MPGMKAKTCLNQQTTSLVNGKILQKQGNIEKQHMFNTFNMGIGMVLAVNKYDADEARAVITGSGGESYIIGSVTKGERVVKVC